MQHLIACSLTLIGENDTDPHHPDLNQSARAKAQGQHRLERGQDFYAAAQEAATQWGVSLR